MKTENIVLVLFVSVIILFFVLLGYWTFGVWTECRVDHSWFYCLKLISK